MTPTKLRVTQNDIAKAAGVHNTTVSLALRNSPSIPEATRNRIRALAEELGYAPDPVLQALAAYRTSRMQRRRQDTLAFITCGALRATWDPAAPSSKHYAGIRHRAAQLGFNVEHFRVGENGMNARRLSSVLYNRGITAAILAVHTDDDEFSQMDWSHVSAVKIGSYPLETALHQVSDNPAGLLRLAMRKIRMLGYRRIGFVLSQTWEEQTSQVWSEVFSAEQARLPAEERLPMHVETLAANGATLQPMHAAADPSGLQSWYSRWRPDCVLAFSPHVRMQLAKLGLCAPRDLGYVDLFVDGANPTSAGLRDNSNRVGEVAVELLMAQLQQNLRGLPEVSTTTLVEGTWIDGTSLPPKSDGSRLRDVHLQSAVA